MSKPKEQRRQVPRKRLHDPIKLLVFSLGEGGLVECDFVDLSELGVGVITRTRLIAGQDCMIAFDIETYTTKKRVNAVGTIVYTEPTRDGRYRAGVQFVDMDNYSKLLLQDWFTLACN
jgi:hypothetical protein